MNRRTRNGLLLAALLTALAAAWLAWGVWAPAETPQGQPPLVELDAARLANLQREFNAAAEKTRLLVLLSPT